MKLGKIVPIVLTGCLTLFSKDRFSAAPMHGKHIEVQGHRGARAARPENTLPAFSYALAAGVDSLELDVAVTKDNILVVSHDLSINPELCLGADKKRLHEPIPIRSLTLSQVKQYDCGSLKNKRFPDQIPVPGTTVPSLAEVFELVKTSPLPTAATVGFNIETKIIPRETELTPNPENYARLLLETIRKSGMLERVTIQSFDHRTLKAVKKFNPRVKISALIDFSLPDLASIVRATHAEIVSPNLNWITAEAVTEVHAAGARVIPWVANTQDEWDYLIACGVDGIITDDPKALLAYLKDKKLR